MKTFVEFYTYSTGYIAGTIPPQFGKPELIPATGDRSVIQIDSRLSQNNVLRIAEIECKKRGFIGYKILKGDNLLSCQAKTSLIKVENHANK